ncbi:MAG TPA: RusA family crossover junction endodeoxyribonuclease [Stellaceae bacterium]|nr:RusA family crossover junction endodeoxyribonuclease [Stellaceae bacterium]
MTRRRPPQRPPALFDYIVKGRPVSAQPRAEKLNEKDTRMGRKESGLGRWRAKIRAAIDAQMEAIGYELHFEPMRVQIVWFKPDVESEDTPDLDNITKPFLDSLEGRVIVNNRTFHEIHLRKVETNHQFEPEPELVFDHKAQGISEFVYVRVEPLEWDRPTRLVR